LEEANMAKTQSNGTEVAARLRPLGDRVVVRPSGREETTRSGIVIPDTAKEKPQRGTVIAVGDGRRDEDGNRIPMDITAGSEVLFAKYSGTEFKLEDEEYLILSEKDILAIVAD
jgi:chaperonin GroES